MRRGAVLRRPRMHAFCGPERARERRYMTWRNYSSTLMPRRTHVYAHARSSYLRSMQAERLCGGASDDKASLSLRARALAQGGEDLLVAGRKEGPALHKSRRVAGGGADEVLAALIDERPHELAGEEPHVAVIVMAEW